MLVEPVLSYTLLVNGSVYGTQAARSAYLFACALLEKGHSLIVVEHNIDLIKCAEVLKHRLLEAGADKVDIFSTEGHPIVYGEKMIDPSKPTVLVYGHYDVQPAEPLELWKHGPFDPTIVDPKEHKLSPLCSMPYSAI